MKLLRALGLGLAPPVCVSCGRLCGAEAILCGGCKRSLAAVRPVVAAGPPGLDRAWSSAPYEGIARDLVIALKFRRLLPASELMADRIHWLAPAVVLGGAIVPVPPAPLRALRRGFDPAAELGAALSERLGAPLQPCLCRRGGGRQLGRRRAARVGAPPRIEARGPVPRSVLLVDDVLTTGATLSACARALRAAGATRVSAATFARRL